MFKKIKKNKNKLWNELKVEKKNHKLINETRKSMQHTRKSLTEVEKLKLKFGNEGAGEMT
jgi:arabinogalactan endo-1,4-beta-galactosidase